MREREWCCLGTPTGAEDLSSARAQTPGGRARGRVWKSAGWRGRSDMGGRTVGMCLESWEHLVAT